MVLGPKGKKLRITILKEALSLGISAPQPIVENIRELEYSTGPGGTEHEISGPFSPEPDSHPQPPI